MVFRLVPPDERDAKLMISELHAQKLLGDFRNEKAPDRDALVNVMRSSYGYYRQKNKD